LWSCGGGGDGGAGIGGAGIGGAGGCGDGGGVIGNDDHNNVYALLNGMITYIKVSY